mgnify:CR=1 FL=1
MLIVIGLGTTLQSSQAQSETCPVSSLHAGFTFSIEHVDVDWACRLQEIIGNYTITTKVGPIRTGLSESLYRNLLDRPPLAAALINRLDLGLYKSEARGPGRFWGHDGEGTEGIVQLVFQDRTSRIYYLEGSHDSRLLPRITGKAVVLSENGFGERRRRDGSDGQYYGLLREAGQSLPLGSGHFAAPVDRGTVKRKLSKGVETVNRLSRVMRQDPDRVLFEAMDPPALPDEDVAFVKQALESLPHPGGATPSRTPSP